MIASDFSDRPSDPAVLRRAERALIGSFLVAGTTDGVRVAPEDFDSETARLAFRAMRAMSEAGEGLDIVTVAARLEQTHERTPTGNSWLTALASTLDSIPDVENRSSYADIIRTAAKRRKRAAWAK